MHSLHAVDYTIIAVYFALSLIVGLLMTRRASASLDHYFLAGRSLPWYLLGIAGMTNWFDMTGTMLITSFLFLLGPRGIFVEFRGGAVLILAFMLVYTGKWHRRSGCMTGAEWMTYRFGTGPDATAIRILTALRNVVWTVAALGYLVRGTAQFMAVMFPWPPMATTLGILAISTIYTMCAGFYGVVLTDLIQGVIIIGACVAVAWLAGSQVADSASFAATAEKVTGVSDWAAALPPTSMAIPDVYGAQMTSYEPLLMFALIALFRNVLDGMGCGAENRYFGARSDRDCGLQSLLQGVTVAFRWPMMMGFAVMGVLLVQRVFPDPAPLAAAAAQIKAVYPATTDASWNDLMSSIANSPQRHPPELIAGLGEALGPDWPGKLPLVGFGGGVNPEQVLPAVLLNELPTGLKGILLVAMIAALMSTFTGTVNGTSAQCVRDLYQVLLRPAAGNRELIAMSWLSTLLLVLGGVYMGVAARSINDIWSWLVMGLGASGLGGLLRFYWWRCNGWGMFIGTMLSAGAAVIQRIVQPDMPELQQFVLMSLLSFGGTVAGSLLTAPTAIATLRNFYNTTKPFGAWGPLRRELSREESAARSYEHRNDILAIPFALLWQITLFILPMLLVIKAYGAFWQILPAFLVAAAGLYWFWYRVLPRAAPAFGGPTSGRSPGGTENLPTGSLSGS